MDALALLPMSFVQPKIGLGIAIGVGAAFDLLSGTTVQAPRWIQRSGFEWLFRLAMEPRRLYRRYFFVVPKYLQFFATELIKYHIARRALARESHHNARDDMGRQLVAGLNSLAPYSAALARAQVEFVKQRNCASVFISRQRSCNDLT